jgi:hypothetical protein
MVCVLGRVQNRRAQIWVVLLEAIEPISFDRAVIMSGRLFCQTQAPVGMGAGHNPGFATRRQLIPAKFADGFQHPIPRRTRRLHVYKDERMLHQPGQEIKRLAFEGGHSRTDCFSRCRIPTTHKDRQAPEEFLFLWSKNLVAPIDRLADRALALGEVARPTGQQRERLIEAGQ